MKVLLVCNLNTGNTYFDSLYHHLLNKGLDVSIGESEFWDNNNEYDIIHVHFLEALFNWKIYDITINDVSKLKFRLETLSKGGVTILFTRHNEFPHHFNNNQLIREVYRLFFRYTNGIIHLGKFSLKDYSGKYPHLAKRIFHTIINHGNYFSLKNEISRAFAREILNIPKDQFVLLCFGNFRKQAERDLVLKAFNRASIKNKTLLCTSWNIQGKPKTLFRRLEAKLLSLRKRFYLHNSFVANDNIQTYLNASDVLIVPRINSLNSGLVYLGLSFGKIVIGPNIGNIKEVIEESNNLLFDPKDHFSLVEAIEKSAKMEMSHIGFKNMVYAREICSWTKIAEEHISFYKKMMVSQKV